MKHLVAYINRSRAAKAAKAIHKRYDETASIVIRPRGDDSHRMHMHGTVSYNERVGERDGKNRRQGLGIFENQDKISGVDKRDC